MTTRLTTILMTLLATLSLLPASMAADDATIKKQLVGSWKGPNNETIVLKENGVMISSDMPGPQTWDVREGVFHTKFHRNEDFFKIISLTKAKFVIQDMYHGRHTGTWTRR